jgi:hypothetical protein
VIEAVIVITETNLIQEMIVGSETMNSKIISIMFKIWFEMFYIQILTTAVAEVSDLLMIFDKVLVHHGSRYKDSSPDQVVTIGHANLLNL